MPQFDFRIFLSSTSQDLEVHRAKIFEIIDRLGEMAVRMETFNAQPTVPLMTCKQQVQSADALVVIVGHRYGWIPTLAQGGDDVKSITWWEVSWAQEANQPVFAFILDP